MLSQQKAYIQQSEGIVPCRGDTVPPSFNRFMVGEQKVAIITGAGQGIGAALVDAYRIHNYRIVANSRSIAPSSDGVVPVPGDIGEPKTAEYVVGEAMARFGQIDTLINNAGICAILYLESAGFVTGETIHVDGGQVAGHGSSDRRR
jgi:short-subunit dehydrogenase involved in D-alanine esterification of teichoic acids